MILPGAETPKNAEAQGCKQEAHGSKANLTNHQSSCFADNFIDFINVAHCKTAEMKLINAVMGKHRSSS